MISTIRVNILIIILLYYITLNLLYYCYRLLGYIYYTIFNIELLIKN